jgi:arylsulfatase A-like enzyme/Tfp pilus assembly protein PilF
MSKPQKYFLSLNLFIGIILMFLLGCSPGIDQVKGIFAGKNVILISIDTCRADYVQPYKDAKSETPNLVSLANDGVLFEDAVTVVPLTLPSHCTMLTGLHPIQHGVRDNFNFILSDRSLTLPELFRESGYSTAGFIGAIILSRRSGISQGFDYFDDEFLPGDFQNIQPSIERSAGRVVASATDWLETRRESNNPFFMFVHFYDPHMLYNPPPPFQQQYAKKPYAGEIAYVDSCIGTFFDYLKLHDLYDDSLVIVVGDHGEGLNDHKEHTHGLFLYETTMWVPLIVKLPEQRSIPKGIRTRQSASTEDIVPTLIELCGLGPIETHGQTLSPWLFKETPTQEREIVLETLYPLTYNWSPMYALRGSDWKYIHAPIAELYQFRKDTAEKQTLVTTRSDISEEMKSRLEDKLVELANFESYSTMAPISTSRAETLMSLGYAAGGISTDPIAPNETLPDPKLKIEAYNLIDRGLAALARGDTKTSIQLFEEAHGHDPNNPTSYANLGLAYTKYGQLDKAIQYTQKALEIAPKSYLNNMQLARIYILKRDFMQAQELLLRFIDSFSTSAEAHFQLARVYAYLDDFDQAKTYLQKAQELMPDMPGIEIAVEQLELREVF